MDTVRDLLTARELRLFDMHAEAVAIESRTIDRCERADVALASARSIRLRLEAIERILEPAIAREHVSPATDLPDSDFARNQQGYRAIRQARYSGG